MKLHLPKPSRPFPVAAGEARRQSATDRMHPRIAAIRLLREHMTDGLAGLDPYDETIFILDARRHEVFWCFRCLELVGVVMNRSPRVDGGERFRALVEADVRAELGLDKPDAPTMDDEPLASRGVSYPEALTAVDVVNRHIDALAAADASVRVLTLVDGQLQDEGCSPATRALHTAKHAYDRRFPDGIREVH